MNKDKFEKLCNKHDVTDDDLPAFMPDMEDKELKNFIKAIGEAKREALCDLKIQCSKCAHQIFITDSANKTGREIMKKMHKAKQCPKCSQATNWIIVGLGNYDREFGGKEDNKEDNEDTTKGDN
jgi:hypothetical protein